MLVCFDEPNERQDLSKLFSLVKKTHTPKYWKSKKKYKIYICLFFPWKTFHVILQKTIKNFRSNTNKWISSIIIVIIIIIIIWKMKAVTNKIIKFKD